jgi:hypothetical protein
MADKVKFLQANDHVLVGNMGSESTQLAPGQRVRLNEENDAHKGILQEIEEGTNTVLEVIEVDLKAEGKATEEREEMLEKADKIAAEQRALCARAAGEGRRTTPAGGGGRTAGSGPAVRLPAAGCRGAEARPRVWGGAACLYAGRRRRRVERWRPSGSPQQQEEQLTYVCCHQCRRGRVQEGHHS